jgi:O-acetyl-ADP-ribose deacetylase (regulator of RNase III)
MVHGVHKIVNMKSNIKIVTGDLITLFKKGEFDAIAHGCNCFNTLSTGLSGGIGYTIGKHFTQACLADEETNYGDPRKLGTMSVGFHRTTKNKIGLILNCYTQYNPGPDLSYSALRIALFKINKKYKGAHIGMPLIGCGIAGGEWDIVLSIIEDVMTDVRVTIVKWKHEYKFEPMKKYKRW